MDQEALIGQGRTAGVYAWGEGRILKLYQEWMPASAVEREYIVTCAAHDAGLPVPAAYELIEMEGRHGIIFERIVGTSLLASLQKKPWTLVAVARRLGELHAQIHANPAPADLPGQRQQIEEGILAGRDLPEAGRTAALAHLRQLPEGQALCHGDFHPDNILLSARGPVIIDWLTGTRGDPLADVARTSLLFETAGLPPGTPAIAGLVINLSRSLLHSIYLGRYLQLHPARRGQIDCWRLPLLAARLREVENYPREKQVVLSNLIAMVKGQSKRRA